MSVEKETVDSLLPPYQRYCRQRVMEEREGEYARSATVPVME
jgi:hypothetical protein